MNLPKYIQTSINEWLGVISESPHTVITDSEWYSKLSTLQYCYKCGCSVGPGEYTDFSCANCRHNRFPWDKIIRLGPYQNELRDWIHATKFKKSDLTGYELGIRLGYLIAEQNDIRCDFLVPVPMTLRRRYQRNIDHTLTITRGISKITKYPIKNVLSRSARPVQRAVTQSQRRDNIRHTFSLRWFNSVKNKNIILVDDVTTTRATLIEATRTLLAANASCVTCAVIAAVDPAQKTTNTRHFDP